MLFDSEEVGATDIELVFDLPGDSKRLYAEATGIKQVLVNGVTTVLDGEATDALPGKVLRSGADTATVPVPLSITANPDAPDHGIRVHYELRTVSARTVGSTLSPALVRFAHRAARATGGLLGTQGSTRTVSGEDHTTSPHVADHVRFHAVHGVTDSE